MISRTALLAVFALGLVACAQRNDPRLAGSWRGRETNGWIPVRLQGTPAHVGFQHGYLLAPEISDALAVIKLSLVHDNAPRDWAFFRNAAETMLWPRVSEEYRQELQGISEGLAARGVKVDVPDLVVLNANLELGD